MSLAMLGRFIRLVPTSSPQARVWRSPLARGEIFHRFDEFIVGQRGECSDVGGCCDRLYGPTLARPCDRVAMWPRKNGACSRTSVCRCSVRARLDWPRFFYRMINRTVRSSRTADASRRRATPASAGIPSIFPLDGLSGNGRSPGRVERAAASDESRHR
jgi:hypothetical protein